MEYFIFSRKIFQSTTEQIKQLLLLTSIHFPIINNYKDKQLIQRRFQDIPAASQSSNLITRTVFRQFAQITVPDGAIRALVPVRPQRGIVAQPQTPAVAFDRSVGVVVGFHGPRTGAPDPQQTRIQAADPVVLAAKMRAALDERDHILALLDRLQFRQIRAQLLAVFTGHFPIVLAAGVARK